MLQHCNCSSLALIMNVLDILKRLKNSFSRDVKKRYKVYGCYIIIVWQGAITVPELLCKPIAPIADIKHFHCMRLKLATDGHWAPRSSPRFQESPAYFLLRAALFSCKAPSLHGDECEIERTNMFVLITVGKHSLSSSKVAFIMKGWQQTKLLLLLAFLFGDNIQLYIIQGGQWLNE